MQGRHGEPQAARRPSGARPDAGRQLHGRDRAQGKLVAGVDQNTLLLAYRNPASRDLEGFEIDMLRELSRAIFGRPDKVDFTALTTAQRLPSVRARTVDVVADAVSITCYRRTLTDFSSVYYAASQSVLVPRAPTRARSGTYAASASARRAARPRSPGSRRSGLA